MRYAPNEPGIEALKTMADAITEAVEQVQTLSKNVVMVAEENDGTLGPHKASLDAALENIDAALKQAAGPAGEVSEKLLRVAAIYQEVVDEDRFAGVGN